MTRLLERICYRVGIDAFFYWLNRRRRRVVAFHNVLPDTLLREEDRGGICFRESEFRTAIRELKKHFRITTDFDLPGGLVITFDDGYVNQYETAARVLDEEGGLPAVIFVSGKLVGSRGFENALVIDRILQWKIDVPMDVAARLFGRSFASREQMWSEALLPLFASDGANLGREALARLESACPAHGRLSERAVEYVRQRFDGITEDQIADLRRRGWKVGYHTKNHFPLSRLDDETSERELRPSDGAMRQIPFAYPYGNEDFVSVRDESLVARLGYPCAYSCGAGVGPRYGKFFKRRMMPPIDKCRLHFELSGVRHFLKHRRLLPMD